MSQYLAGQRVPAGLSHATALPDIDFETYSEAGMLWRDGVQKWVSPAGGQKKGLPLVGLGVYAEHPSTEILSVAYNLKDGRGPQLWVPGASDPHDLFDHIAQQLPLEAWNVLFEYMIWNYVGHLKMGWPVLPQHILHDAMAKARAFSLPGKLANAAKVVGTRLKDTDKGGRVIRRYCIPRNPTKNDQRLRIRPDEELHKGVELYEYNIGDIEAEEAVSLHTPDLSDYERAVWQLDQRINIRGVQVDMAGVHACLSILQQAETRYNQELWDITGGEVSGATKVQDMTNWLRGRGIFMDALDEDAVNAQLEVTDPFSEEIRVLEIRGMLASAGAKKIQAMALQTSSDERLRGLFIYHSAHTGRFASGGVQLHNMASGGPSLIHCEGCGAYFNNEVATACPRCGAMEALSGAVEWGHDPMCFALEVLAHGDLQLAEAYFGDKVVRAIAGSVRGLFIARPGFDLMCSDYDAIEARVLAMLAGEQWRIDVFRSHGKIYEMCAANLTGTPFDEIAADKSHPLRKPYGKVPELASGYQGWIGAWLAFGADKYMAEDEIKRNILQWRADSPAIVEMWGGQYRKHPERWEFTYELHGLEGAFVAAILNPGVEYPYRYITYVYRDGTMYCRLPSGRYITYHKARLVEQTNRFHGQLEYKLRYTTWNTNPKKGGYGWVEVDTYGGSLTENVTQAVARDIFVHGMLNLDAAGYRTVLHTHDEMTCEVPVGWGAVEEMERLMCTLPDWCADWPITASGGWRGQRYRKD